MHVMHFNQGLKGRSPWFGTACCPSNIARLIPQIPGMMYAHTDNDIYCTFYAGTSTVVPLSDGKVTIKQTTNYPFDESVRFENKTRAVKAKVCHAFPDSNVGRQTILFLESYIII